MAPHGLNTVADAFNNPSRALNGPTVLAAHGGAREAEGVYGLPGGLSERELGQPSAQATTLSAEPIFNYFFLSRGGQPFKDGVD